MNRLTRYGTPFVLLFALAAGTCGYQVDPACTPALLAPADTILTDASGLTLAAAVAEYQPSDDELKLTAAYWALLATGYQDGSIAPAFFEARLDEQVMALTDHYPTFFTSCASSPGVSPSGAKRLAVTGAGCSCDASCLPSTAEVGSLLWDAGGLGLSIFSKSKQAAALVKQIRFYADDVVNKVAAAKVLKPGFKTYDATRAITDGISREDALKVLEGVGNFVAVAGTVAGAAVAAGASAPSLAVIAAAGAVVGAGIAGVKLGSKVNTMMDAYQVCADCQAQTCVAEGCPAKPCESNQVCVGGQCVDQTSSTTCALRTPSCCAGEDDSCTAPDSACYCDAFCVTAGDCCPDACSVCGFCG